MIESTACSNNMEPVISVIVASYNKTATLLSRCIDSLLAQTQDNLEIIIIDDCSTDDSALILTKYADQYPDKIRFVQNEVNKGKGATANYGVSLARAPYIGFVDADDYVEKKYYQKLYRIAEKTNADVVCGDFILVTKEGYLSAPLLGRDNMYLHAGDNLSIRNTHNIIINGKLLAGFWGGGSPCTKIIRKEKLQEFPFFEGRRCDDIPAVLPVCSNSTVAYAAGATYYYVQTDDSMERGTDINKQLEAFAAIALTLQRYRDTKADIAYSQLMIAQSFTAVACSLVCNPANRAIPDLYSKICNYFDGIIPVSLMGELLDTKQNKYLKYALHTIYENHENEYAEALSVFKRYFSQPQFPIKKEEPIVSIVIPAYNAQNYLHEAIESALKQTYQRTEVIVVNDGSRDAGATELIAKSYGNAIRYLYKPNGGVGSALNYGIQNMRGSYFSWLSHDDLYRPEKVEEELTYLQKYGNDNSIVFSAYKTIDPKGNELDEYHLPVHVYSNPKCLLAIDPTYTMNGCALLIPKALFEKHGLFNDALKYTQDYDMWLRFAQHVDFLYIDKCLIFSRQHPQQDSKTAGVLVTDEADRFHCRAVQTLQPEESKTYLVNGQTLEKLYQTHKDYGFPGFATAIMEYWIRCALFENPEKAEKILEKTIGVCAESLQDVVRIHEQNKQGKPVLMVYSNIWVRGGIERVLASLLPMFSERFQVVLVSAPYENMEGFPLPEDIEHIRIKHTHPMELETRLGVLALLFHTDIFWGNPNILPQTLPVYRVMHNNGIKSIAQNHYYYFFPYFEPTFHSVCEDRHKAFEYADIVLWLTSFSTNACKSRNNNVALMPNPIPITRREKPCERNPKQLIAVGRFYDIQKRLDRIIDVFAAVHAIDPTTSLLVVGGYSRSMQVPDGRTIDSIISEHSLSSAIRFVGEVADVQPYYEESAGLLMASDSEGFGMVIGEAGECGVPCFIYDTPFLDDIVTDGKNGLIEYSPHCNKLAMRIATVLNDQQAWSTMSKNAYDMAQRFSRQTVVQKWHELFDLLLSYDNTPMEQLIQNSSLTPSESMNAQTFTDGLREALNAGICIAQNNSLSHSLNSSPTSNGASDASYWAATCYAMERTLSWRITKPLRLVRKTMNSVKHEGMKATTKKIVSWLLRR